MTFIPNLAWSCRILELRDDSLWRVIDRIILRIHRYFNLDMLQSVIPSYYEVGRLSLEQDKIFDALEKRFREVKQEVLLASDSGQSCDSTDKHMERIAVIQSYLEKIRKARSERVDQGLTQKDEYDMISSDDDDEGESTQTK